MAKHSTIVMVQIEKEIFFTSIPNSLHEASLYEIEKLKGTFSSALNDLCIHF